MLRPVAQSYLAASSDYLSSSRIRYLPWTDLRVSFRASVSSGWHVMTSTASAIINVERIPIPKRLIGENAGNSRKFRRLIPRSSDSQEIVFDRALRHPIHLGPPEREETGDPNGLAPCPYRGLLPWPVDLLL